MELRDFIKQYLMYCRIPVSEIPQKATFEFAMAFTNDSQCREWFIMQRYRDLKIDAAEFCCIEFATWHLEDITQTVQHNQHPSPEKFVIYWKDFKSFGIQHSSQKFCLPLHFCPWCGKQLRPIEYYKQHP